LTVLYSFHVVEKTYSGSHVRLSGLSSNFGTETILFDSRELPTTLMQLLAKMPKISQAKPQSLQKTKRKKTRWMRYKNDWQTMIKKQDHNDPTHTVGRTKNTST
jgi:hypothetical protein